MKTYYLGWRPAEHFYNYLLPNFGDVGTYTIINEDNGGEMYELIVTTDKPL